MKKNLCLLSMLLCSILIHAQTAEVKLGKPYPVVDAPIKHYIEHDHEMLSVKIDDEKFTLQKMSVDELTEISKTTYEDFPKKFSFERITEYHGRYYIFYTVSDKKTKITELFSREINFNNGTLMPNHKKIL